MLQVASLFGGDFAKKSAAESPGFCQKVLALPPGRITIEVGLRIGSFTRCFTFLTDLPGID